MEFVFIIMLMIMLGDKSNKLVTCKDVNFLSFSFMNMDI